MFILFTNLFLAKPFRLENTLECYNLRGGQGGSRSTYPCPLFFNPETDENKDLADARGERHHCRSSRVISSP